MVMASWRLAVVLGLGVTGISAQACLVEIRDLRSTGAGGRGGATTTTGAGAGTTTGSAGAAPGSGGNGGDPGPCPSDMVHVTDPDNPLADYCIDRYEATIREHDIFLLEVQAGNVTPDQPSPQCDGNVRLRQEGSFCPNNLNGPDLAVNCVDWCDAYAYCAYEGKRLCGALGNGGPVVMPAGQFPGSQTDEWEYACSEGGRRIVPYLPSGSPDQDDICSCHFPRHWEPCNPDTSACAMCEGPSENHNAPGLAEGYPGCEGGYPGLFNMVGNVGEWTDRCDGDGPDATCVTRGGSVGWGGDYQYDDCNRKQRQQPRQDNLGFDDNSQWRYHIGIRCCKDAG